MVVQCESTPLVLLDSVARGHRYLRVDWLLFPGIIPVVALTMKSTASSTSDDSIVTPRHPDTLHNFGPASYRDEILFTCERPGGDPPSPDALIPASTVKEWANFMKSKGITDVLILLEDEELNNYESPGLLELYKQEGLRAHREPMGKPGVSTRIKEVIRKVSETKTQQGEMGRVVAHCTHGMGRSGRVAAGWLVMQYGLSPVQATAEAIAAAQDHGVERMGAPAQLETWLAQ